ncbi:MAG: SemiSWEET family transporter [Nanoarchaeota archaeon]
MTTLSILATIFGTIGGLANIPQAYRIFKRKSAKDISIITYSLVMVGTIVWFLYGIQIKDFPLTFANAAGFVCVGAVILGWFIYGGEKKRK